MAFDPRRVRVSQAEADTERLAAELPRYAADERRDVIGNYAKKNRARMARNLVRRALTDDELGIFEGWHGDRYLIGYHDPDEPVHFRDDD